MKRQLLGTQYGFTLIELMLVITLFGLFIATTSVFDYRPQTEMEKADRIQNAVSNIIRGEIQNVSIGRMPERNGRVANMIQIVISTGSVTSFYFTGSTASTPFASGRIITPFYDRDPLYTIKSVLWTGSTITGTGHAGTGILIIEPTGITFSGAGIFGSGFTTLEIRVGYESRTRKITLDRRSGKVSEYKIY